MTTGSHETVRVDDLLVRFGELDAVSGLCLEARRGESVAIVGPSGAGKSTLLRTIAGITRPTSGSVWIDGRNIADLRPGREMTALVGMIQQRLDLVPQLSVRNNVEAGNLGRWSLTRAMAGLFLPIHDAGSTSAIERVGLAGREGERTSRLSGGEQQRVALARLLVQDPAVILADEPVASLDPALAHDVLDLLTGVGREFGKTVIASLHSPGLARRHFDRVIGLRDGRIEFEVPSGELTDEMLQSVYRPGRRSAVPAPSVDPLVRPKALRA